MHQKYRSGFERLSSLWTDTDSRYAMALRTVKDNFTGFRNKDGYDARNPQKLTAAQRKQIRRYYNLFTSYTEGSPVYIMPVSELPKRLKKNRHNIEATMKAVHMPEGRKRAKKLFVRYDGENVPKIGVRNNSPVVINEGFGYAREIVELNKYALAVNPVGTILDAAKHTEGAKFYRILNGAHEFYGPKGTKGGAADLRTLAYQVEKLQQKYAIGTKDSWERWLYGIAAYYTNKTAAEVIVYQRDTTKAFKARLKAESEKIRRKRK